MKYISEMPCVVTLTNREGRHLKKSICHSSHWKPKEKIRNEKPGPGTVPFSHEMLVSPDH